MLPSRSRLRRHETRSFPNKPHYSGAYERIYAVVRQIPRGKIASYGQVAELAGLEGHARQVGYALHATPDAIDIPWQRVVNAKGEISSRSDPLMEGVQQSLLEAEMRGTRAPSVKRSMATVLVLSLACSVGALSLYSLGWI